MTNQIDASGAGAPTAGAAITSTMIDALNRTKSWVKLVGVLMFIAAAFTVLGALAVIIGAGFAGSQKGAMPFGVLALMALVYVAMAAVYVYLGLHLLRYSSAIVRLMNDGLAESMEMALQHQQKFWRLAGILALVGLVLGLLGVVAAIAIPIFASRTL